MTASHTSRKAPTTPSEGHNQDNDQIGDKIKVSGAVKVRRPAPKKTEFPSSGSNSPSASVAEEGSAAGPSSSQGGNSTDSVTCKHCKKFFDKSTLATHSKQCLREKQDRLKKKKEAKEAKDHMDKKEKENEGDADTELADASKTGEAERSSSDKSKNAKKSAVKTDIDSNAKKGKKRKAEGDGDKSLKKQKKKEEPKAKAPKLKGPVDVEKQCGVLLPNGAMCARSLTCKSHAMGAKRAVPGRSLPYDMLLAQYQKKNQAKQQKAAIDANAPLQDDLDAAGSGPVDSDEERDAIMAAIVRAHPQPLVTKPVISTRSKYQYIRMKEMLHNALGGSRGSGLFSTTSSVDTGRSSVFASSNEPGFGRDTPLPLDVASEASLRRSSSMAQRAVGSNMQNGPASRKPSGAGITVS